MLAAKRSADIANLRNLLHIGEEACKQEDPLWLWNPGQTPLEHPAGTSTDSDKCDLSKDSDLAPLTLGSMVNNFFYHLFYFSQEIYLSKDLGEIYMNKIVKIGRSELRWDIKGSSKDHPDIYGFCPIDHNVKICLVMWATDIGDDKNS